ncbi:MAG: DUF1499 domain-containing protein [Proteobacteria bacterium]|jgi:uncharacterized protein (DUF1499 family)|nr:DUF1499 domain-containing protein [Pseudomonadota bacterium]
MNIVKLGQLSGLILFAVLTTACSFAARTMDLRSIERARSLNDALACSPGLCRAKPEFESAIFLLGKKDLLDRARAVITAEPRTELIGKDIGLNQLVFVQRSASFGFPDTIWVQSADVDQRTSVIIYSRSNYGYWDLGVNRDRVRDWLKKLEGAIKHHRAETQK